MKLLILILLRIIGTVAFGAACAWVKTRYFMDCDWSDAASHCDDDVMFTYLGYCLLGGVIGLLSFLPSLVLRVIRLLKR